jgi:purine-binding chemotaxis protein CheW
MPSGKSFAKEEVMEEYLDDLLFDTADPVAATDRVAKLLEKATTEVVATEIEPVELVSTSIDEEINQPITALVDIKDVATEAETSKDAEPAITAHSLEERVPGRFQALFFEVAGLTMAVPLIDLGGIHKIDKIGALIGKPDWFMGVMLHREEKINVVNAAKWVMPEKYTKTLEDALNYRYVINLAGSDWGFASDRLINTVELNKVDVKWRRADGKRPWLAGMVKQRMCALIDVYQLISLLNAGLDGHQK